MEAQGGSFLDQILHLKQEIDNVNARIGLEIRETRKLESELVRCDEQEKESIRDEAELVRMFAAKTNCYSDACARCEALEELEAQQELQIVSLRSRSDAAKRHADDNRNDFIAFSKSFQRHQDEITQATDASTKVELRRKVSILEQEVEAQDKLNKLYARENEELHKQVEADERYNHMLLADISQLKDVLKNVEISRKTLESSPSSRAMELEKRQLQACILSLRSSLACLQGNQTCKRDQFNT